MIKNYKRVYYKMSTYYPPYKLELDLANYATKDDVKNIAQ